MKRFIPSGLIVFAGVLGLASGTAQSEQDVAKARKKMDRREVLLRRFLRRYQCPAERYSGIFVREADAHGLDWRLLPSLAIVETGGGNHASGNNLFGWANGSKRFETIGDAIHTVASTLAMGRAYKGKDLNGKLFAYNPDSLGYGKVVADIMDRISPAPESLLSK